MLFSHQKLSERDYFFIMSTFTSHTQTIWVCVWNHKMLINLTRRFLWLITLKASDSSKKNLVDLYHMETLLSSWQRQKGHILGQLEMIKRQQLTQITVLQQKHEEDNPWLHNIRCPEADGLQRWGPHQYRYRKLRLPFTQDHQKWATEDWKKISWSLFGS